MVGWQGCGKAALAWKRGEPASRPVAHAWSCQLHGRRPSGVEMNGDGGHCVLPVKLARAWGKEERVG